MTLFEIYFLRVTLIDVLDVGVVALLIYTVYRVMQRTIAIQVFVGLIVLYFFDVLVTAADMTMLRFLFRTLSEVFVVGIIVLFQPELRRLLLMLGQTTGLQRFFRPPDQSKIVEDVLTAVADMSQKKTGALIVFRRSTPLDTYIETGTLLQSQVNPDLLIAVFQKNSPLHDGAMIIQSGRIEAVRCILPVSASRELNPNLGLRHRSAMGLCEQSDAFIIVVSEERGKISTAHNGKLMTNLSLIELRNQLHKAISLDPDRISDETRTMDEDTPAKPTAKKRTKRGIGSIHQEPEPPTIL
ncbi:MAG TPA: diadenylate cyclase CdaA [Rhodothermales bacterium]|nr:diadenylate cyclase CdaA [Rhodothermales bacterium]